MQFPDFLVATHVASDPVEPDASGALVPPDLGPDCLKQFSPSHAPSNEGIDRLHVCCSSA